LTQSTASLTPFNVNGLYLQLGWTVLPLADDMQIIQSVRQLGASQLAAHKLYSGDLNNNDNKNNDTRYYSH